MITRKLLSVFPLAALLSLVTTLGCSDGGADTQSSEVGARKSSAEGAFCANGVFGTPNQPCKAGLICDFGEGTAPTGPASGSSSAKGGTCVKAATTGQFCSDGVFGTPRTLCADGLVCDFGEGTAPTGPASGSSSAKGGTCVKAATAGQPCSEGIFGTPRALCARGLVCHYASGTAPSGPVGSSSATMGTCEEGAARGEACGDGVFGAPNRSCAEGLTCKFADGRTSTAPTGPKGSSSAAVRQCLP